ncbi:alpha carbonic anhydrase 7-like, partial [Impatiens glandulifera]|uniref:alpha carbonic anhydrase 7-like n=1 Tax=Impatiens glandulifera TaxID=253017 RepID=UPI001FB1173F
HVDDEREFTYVKDSSRGPQQWGDIKEEWGKCKNGTMQSPIDLLNERVETVSHLGRMKRNYKPSNATLLNRGHDMMLKWKDGAGIMEINGIDYELKQCHWHSPSEHSVNGKKFDLEAHLVHESKSGMVAVIGIMYKLGRPDNFLSQINDHLGKLVYALDVEKVVGMIDPRAIKIGSRKYYRYQGSLTVPPCTENVIWTIVNKVRTVSREQVKLLRDAVHDKSKRNSRPIQSTNLRKVELYRPDDQELN